jgi:hypothetical protein
MLAILAAKKSLQRIDASKQSHQIVFASQREDGGDQIVPHSLLFEVHLESISEEIKEVGGSVVTTLKYRKRPDLISSDYTIIRINNLRL